MYPVGSWLQFLKFFRERDPESGVAVHAGGIAGGWRNVAFLGLTSMLTDVSSEMVISVLPIYLITILRLSPVQFGVIDGLYQGVAALVQLVSGVLTDRWRKYKEVAAAGYGLSALCRIGLLTTGSTAGIASVLVIDRLGKGVRTAPRDALISLSAPREQLGLAFGIHRAMDAAGAMLGPILAFALLTLIPGAFDVVFVTSFLIALIGFAVLALFVRNHPRALEATERTIDFAIAVQLLRNRTFRRIAFCAIALGVTTVSDAFVYLALQRELNFGSGAFPLLYVVTSLSYLLLAIPAGRLADRVGRVAVFTGGYALLVLLYVVLLTAEPGRFMLVLVLMTLGAYYAATEGVLMALGSAELPESVRSSGLAVLTTGTAIARFGASALFGLLWARFGLSPAVATFAVGLTAALVVTRLNLPQGESHV